MKTMMKFSREWAIVPFALGPIFMVVGTFGSQERIMLIPTYVGALSLGVSLIFLVKTISSMRVELEELKKRVAESVAV